MKIAIIGTSSQEWNTAGQYLFGLLGPCIDPEHGAKVWKMPPFVTVDMDNQVDRNSMMAMAPNLTWINREQERARNMIALGMTAVLHDPAPADPAAPPVPPVRLDALAGAMQLAPMTILRQIRTTSTIVFPGAMFSWVNMRIHTGHGRTLRQGTCQTIKNKSKLKK